MARLVWYTSGDGSMCTQDGRYFIEQLDNGYVLLFDRASGLRKLCQTSSEAVKRARASACGFPHQFT